MKITERFTCRSCSAVFPTEGVNANVLTLGDQAIVDFIPPGEEGRGEAPLDLVICEGCGLLQLKHTIDPDVLYRTFYYRSGINEQMREALKDVVTQIRQRVNLKTRDYVCDIGSNDGTLLNNYPLGIIKVGFEPAIKLAEESQPKLNVVVANYFNAKQALASSGGEKYMAISAIAMFYDLDDPNQFLEDICDSLHPNGLFVVQMNYLGSMLRNLSFDNISHEHLCYYSLRTIKTLFEKNGLQIVDVELNDVNGGSFRIYARKIGHFSDKVGISWKESKSVGEILDKEEFLITLSKIVNFIDAVREISSSLVGFLIAAKEAGKKVYVYGASTRGLTLLQTALFGLEATDYIIAAAERDENKYGLRMAGVNIPIIPEAEAREKADYMILLPYHFWQSISKRETEWMSKGGKFVIPVPSVKVVSLTDIGLVAQEVEREIELLATGRG